MQNKSLFNFFENKFHLFLIFFFFKESYFTIKSGYPNAPLTFLIFFFSSLNCQTRCKKFIPVLCIIQNLKQAYKTSVSVDCSISVVYSTVLNHSDSYPLCIVFRSPSCLSEIEIKASIDANLVTKLFMQLVESLFEKFI